MVRIPSLAKLIALACCLLGICHASANPARVRGLPYYEFFSEKEMKDSTEGHYLTSAPDGTIFLCKETGIFSFDGSNWKLVLPTPATRDKIRCLIWTEEGIFAAGYRKIGLIEISDSGSIAFRQLNEAPLSLDTGDAYNWAKRIGDTVFFVGISSISRVDIHTKEIETIDTIPYMRASEVVADELIVSNSDFGLGKLDGDSVDYFQDYRRFIGKNLITGFAVTSQDELLFTTQSGEVYRTPYAELGQRLPELIYRNDDAISSIARLAPDRFALAISRVGIHVIDHKGNLLDSLDKSYDHRLGGVETLHADSFGTLWSLSHNGVTKSLFNHPLTRIDERHRPSLHYPLAYEWNDHVYLLNEGSLFKNEHVPPGKPVNFTEAMPGFDKSISAAVVSDGTFYLVADRQICRFDGEQPIPLGHTGHVERLALWNQDKTYLFATSTTQLKLFKLIDGRFERVTTLDHNAGLINKIAQTSDGTFWLEIGMGSIMRVTTDGKTLSAKIFDWSDGVPEDWFAVWQHGEEVLFTERSGVYEFDNATERFAPSDRFEKYFPHDSGSIHRLATDASGNVWASYKSGNYVLWNLGNGDYLMESATLDQMGALFANQYLFLKNGDAVILTYNEVLHVDASKPRPSPTFSDARPLLTEVAKAGGHSYFYNNLGYRSEAAKVTLPATSRSLTFAFSNTFSSTTSAPEFQFFLEGLSEDWTRWDQRNQITFNNLKHGDYVLKTRTRLSPASPALESKTPFTIPPTAWETPLAYAAYALIGVLALFALYRLLSRNLKSANEKLEKMVIERTREIERKNGELNQNASKLQETLDELRQAQDELMNTSRKAGMAEVATNVLHNVGNVLNSINVGVASLGNHIQAERIIKLVKVSDLIRSHQNDLTNFLQNDKRGQTLPVYLEKLANVLLDDFQRCRIEIDCMDENIEHVKRIINTQQSHAKTVDIAQEFDLGELIDSAIHITIGDTDHALFEINREIEPNLRVHTDKHRLLQMITNFIKNAKESVVEAQVPLGLISITAANVPDQKSVCIQISDNGLGISKENLDKIFQHGFTTKMEGHGFGMHSCANSAKALGGELSIDSEGPGKGATVTLVLPSKAKASRLPKPSDRLDLAESDTMRN